MTRLFEFIHRERLYFLLIIFILFVNAIIVNLDIDTGRNAVGAEEAASEWNAEVRAVKEVEDIFKKPEDMEKLLAENRPLAVILSLVSLLVIAVFLLGMLSDIALISFRMSKGPVDIATFPASPAGWTLVDVGKVVALFLFFGHVIIICESLLISVLPALKDDNFRMILNSFILDLLAVIFIIYFAVVKYGGKLQSLGLSVKNFSANLFYGLWGYVASVPLLIAALAVIMLIVKITGYVPEKQPVVELFMKETNVSFLFFSTLFAAIIGPAIEEIFFRGFMYKALKRHIGLLGAALLTSVIFAALHTNIVGFLPIFMLGLLLVYLYEKTGTLVASMTVHITHNLGMVLFVFLLKQLKG